MQKYHLENLDCANCAVRIEDAVNATEGVRFASVDFATSTLFLDAESFSPVVKRIQQVEPEVRVVAQDGDAPSAGEGHPRSAWIGLLIAGLLFVFGLLTNQWLESTPYGIAAILVFGLAYLISGRGVLVSAVRNITRGQVFDEHFLMTVATIGAMAIGEFPEAVGVMLFYNLGELLQGLSVNRSRRSIQALLEIRPDRARVVAAGGSQEIHPGAVKVGDLIQVYAGERIPLDGEVIHGNSLVDTAALTGETVPVPIKSGDTVLAGAINLDGMLTIQVSRPFSESSIARIMALVEQASSRKAATEKFITRFARVYSPIVVAAALGVAIVPPLLAGANFSDWIYRAMVVLVISCPCALVVSIPLGYFGGVGGASRQGILVKGSNYLDVLAGVKSVIFDKTGTLTHGVFEVTEVEPKNGFTRDDLLRYAVQAETLSNHPIARSIRAAYGDSQELSIDSAQEIAGHGVQTTVEGRVLLAGNDPLLHREQVAHDPVLCEDRGTVVHVAVDGTYAGRLVISDELKPDAVQAIQSLRTLGVDQVLMLTGDKQAAAQEMATRLGVDDFRAELLPEDKVAALEQVLTEHGDGRKVAFVGDGINDAPALARADVGIAMGGLGSEAAIETADVVVMTDSPLKVAQAIRIGQKTRRIVWQNIALALLIKAGFIALGIAGEATMWEAVFADMGVALLAIFNASRVLR